MDRAEGIPLELRKFVAPEFVFGAGARRLAGRSVRNLGGSHVLLVTDPGVVAAGWVEDVLEGLGAEGVEVTVFSQVTPNPRDHEVMAGAEAFAAAGCDALLAVGGGSVSDCAKGIGIVRANGAHILTFEGVDRVLRPMPPLVCVPTTGGASADVSQFCIVTNTTERVKIAIISKAVVPDMSLVDPETLTTMDPFLSACTGMDALVHGIEAFVSNAASPLTDLHALRAIELLSQNLVASIEAPDNLQLRGAVMLGSLEAGLAFSNASLGGVHAVAHSLGGYLDFPHGECNSLLLEHFVDFNFPCAPERYTRIAQAMGLDLRGMTEEVRRSALFAELVRVRNAIGIGGTLGNKGLTSADIPILAGHALEDPCVVTNPRRPNARDLEVILEESM